MKKLSLTLTALWLVLVSPAANAWFFFWVPGSVTSAVSDAITGDEGENCVAAYVKVGDAIRMPDGSIGTIKSLSGKSVRCNNPAQPIRALIVPETLLQQPVAEPQLMDLSNSSGVVSTDAPSEQAAQTSAQTNKPTSSSDVAGQQDSVSTPAQKLRELKALYEEGLIDKNEYAAKKKQILEKI